MQIAIDARASMAHQGSGILDGHVGLGLDAATECLNHLSEQKLRKVELAHAYQ